MKRRDFVLALGGAVAAPCAWGADAYPSRPIRWLVGFAVGGASDILVRLVAEAMQKELGATLVVENRPGASGNIAAIALKQAPPDGYTILHGENSVLYINEHLGKIPYNPERDFSYIGAIGRSSFTLVVHPSFPAHTLAEFIAYAKANPGRINYGSPGNGSPQRIAMESFQKEWGVELTHVGYKGGAPALQDVRAGQIQAMMTEVSISLPYLRDGGLRGLAICASQRLAALPAIPTFAELGYGSVSAFALHGVVGPAGLPRPIIERLNGAINLALQSPRVVSHLSTNGIQPIPGTPEDFERTVRLERARTGEIIKAVGITAE